MPGDWGLWTGVPRKPWPQSPAPLCDQYPPLTHSLFSVKNHEVLLDCIKAVLKVVILLLARKTQMSVVDAIRFPHIHSWQGLVSFSRAQVGSLPCLGDP